MKTERPGLDEPRLSRRDRRRLLQDTIARVNTDRRHRKDTNT